MYILILMIISKGIVSTEAIKFTSESNCLQAIQVAIEMENKDMKIKARCLKQ